MKPISASDILRRNAPRELLGRSFVHANRYDRLRDVSPAPSARSHLGSFSSVKRKEDYSDECEEIISKKGKHCEDTEDDALSIAVLESNILKVSQLCNKITMDVQESDLLNESKSILADIVEAVRTLADNQKAISTRLSTKFTPHDVAPAKKTYSAAAQGEYSSQTNQFSRPGQTRRLPTGGLVHMNVDNNGKTGYSAQQPTLDPEEVKKKKFADAIREAEKSTLVFNLNMGNVPLQNKVTIQEKASLALTAMAAKKEGKNSSIPSSDSVAALDDFSSMVTNMDFFGTSTKIYTGKNDKDPSNKPFCTIPVRYQFKDRDTRTFAEKTLRDTCGVSCATPYPALVRESIKQVVDHVKKSFPDDYIKVNVLVKEFSLKVSRRPKGQNREWFVLPDLIPLPEEAWNVSVKKIPEGFRIQCNYELDENAMQFGQHSPEKSPTTPPPRSALC